jgi:hypothetical protein
MSDKRLQEWMQADAVGLCRRIEEVAPAHGFHVALTGGCLYKDGPRKDCDLLFYKIRQHSRDVAKHDFKALVTALRGLGLTMREGRPAFEWCVRASFDGKPLDLFFPDAEEGEYDEIDTWMPDGDESPAPALKPDGQYESSADDDINF